jgi:hypothetical protein
MGVCLGGFAVVMGCRLLMMALRVFVPFRARGGLIGLVASDDYLVTDAQANLRRSPRRSPDRWESGARPGISCLP